MALINTWRKLQWHGVGVKYKVPMTEWNNNRQGLFCSFSDVPKRLRKQGINAGKKKKR